MASLATVGLLALGYPFFAMGGLGVAGAALGAALMQRYGGSQPEPDNRRFGHNGRKRYADLRRVELRLQFGILPGVEVNGYE